MTGAAITVESIRNSLALRAQRVGQRPIKALSGLEFIMQRQPHLGENRIFGPVMVDLHDGSLPPQNRGFCGLQRMLPRMPVRMPKLRMHTGQGYPAIGLRHGANH